MDVSAKLDELKSLLTNVQQSADSGFTCRCPAHEDAQNSLSVSLGANGVILLRCHAGCSFVAIAEALDKPQKWFFADSSGSGSGGSWGSLVAAYDYRDVDGQLLYQACRFEKPSPDGGKPKKTFVQRKPDGKGGWLYKLGEVKKVPYRLLELLRADPSKPVLVVEGEKHVDRLYELGFVATCNAGGAGKWRKEFAPYLHGRDVIILPDNDEPGFKHARDVARKLEGAV